MSHSKPLIDDHKLHEKFLKFIYQISSLNITQLTIVAFLGGAWKEVK